MKSLYLILVLKWVKGERKHDNYVMNKKQQWTNSLRNRAPSVYIFLLQGWKVWIQNIRTYSNISKSGISLFQIKHVQTRCNFRIDFILMLKMPCITFGSFSFSLFNINEDMKMFYNNGNSDCISYIGTGYVTLHSSMLQSFT